MTQRTGRFSRSSGKGKRMKPTVAFSTLGCKVNQFESAAMAGEFESAGCRLVAFTGPADIYVINSCAVTGRAAEQSRGLIRRALRCNAAASVVVTGCYAQCDPAAVRAIDPRVLLLGNASKHLLATAALGIFRTTYESPAQSAAALESPMLLLEREPGDIREQTAPCPLTARRFPGRTRALLKVQDGCDNFCAYCIVPSVRGRSRSVPMDAVLRQADLLLAQGYRELVVTGINVGKYGRDLPDHPDITGLLGRLCRACVPARIRLSSIEPPELDETLLALALEHNNFMPHFHLPLQSGDEGVLRRMRRRYGGDLFASVVRRCREVLPHAALGVDVLVGFPGEDEAAFEGTRALLAALPLSSLHVFPYSARPGTPAADMPDQVRPARREERAANLRRLDRTLRHNFLATQLGQVRSVLLEQEVRGRRPAAAPAAELAPESRLLRGHSDNYLTVTVAAPVHLLGQVVDVLLERDMGEGGAWGSILRLPGWQE